MPVLNSPPLNPGIVVSPPLAFDDAGVLHRAAIEIATTLPQLGKQAACMVLSPVANQWANNLGMAEQTLAMAQQATQKLESYVSTINQVRAGIDQVAEKLRAAAEVEWQTSAGELFRTRALQQSGQARKLGAQATHLQGLGESAISDVQSKISAVSSIISAVRSGLDTLTGAVC